VLLDFWFSTCGPCMRAIPELRELQRRYGSQGLQVVGIAYEEGSRTEQAQKVINVRARLGINYVTLLGGNGTGPRSPCPVKTQFQVTSFPTLVLLDEQGNILWRNREGVNSEELRELDFLIRQRLGVAHR
jgi:thiol-disulfide isomerase/thioredoxin